MILFCIPYAGGSEMIYQGWSNYLDKSIKLSPVKLKGRGKRFYEDLYEDIDDAVNDIFNNIRNMIEEEEYAIFGHSMGSILAYELYYKIKTEGLREPKHLFVSGQAAPHKRERKNIHTLPDDEFINKIIELGGTPKEIIAEKELLELFIPMLRSDFKILDTYYSPKREEKIKCNISVLKGEQDIIKNEQILAWNELSEIKSKVYNFKGDHFFINDNLEEIIKIINKTLL